jgi:hypothetical protein
MATRSMRKMDGWTRRLVAVFGVAFAVALLSESLAAQMAADSGRVYEREVFDYPSLGRRNPFRALNSGEQLGPRFEDLVLKGVLYNPAVGSVATLHDEKTGKRYRLREGDRLGEIRVAVIRAKEVDFVITSFGISRRETLWVERDKEIEG